MFKPLISSRKNSILHPNHIAKTSYTINQNIVVQHYSSKFVQMFLIHFHSSFLLFLPKLLQPNLQSSHHFDTKTYTTKKYTYSQDKQSPFTPDSITNISSHSITVSPHLLITRHQTDSCSSNLIKTSPPSILVAPSRFVKRTFKRWGNTLHPLPCQACAPSLHMKSDILLATFVRGVCLNDRGQTSPSVYRGFSSLRVPFRKTAGQSARYRIMPRSQQWLHLNSGRSSFVTIPGIGKTWDPCVHQENGENRQQAEVTQESKLVSRCILVYFSLPFLVLLFFFFFARFSFLFAFDFLFLGDFSMCSFNVFISCWNHVNNLMIKKCDYLKCLWRFWCFDKKSFRFK